MGVRDRNEFDFFKVQEENDGRWSLVSKGRRATRPDCRECS